MMIEWEKRTGYGTTDPRVYLCKGCQRYFPRRELKRFDKRRKKAQCAECLAKEKKILERQYKEFAQGRHWTSPLLYGKAIPGTRRQREKLLRVLRSAHWYAPTPEVRKMLDDNNVSYRKTLRRGERYVVRRLRVNSMKYDREVRRYRSQLLQILQTEATEEQVIWLMLRAGVLPPHVLRKIAYQRIEDVIARIGEDKLPMAFREEAIFPFMDDVNDIINLFEEKYVPLVGADVGNLSQSWESLQLECNLLIDRLDGVIGYKETTRHLQRALNGLVVPSSADAVRQVFVNTAKFMGNRGITKESQLRDMSSLVRSVAAGAARDHEKALHESRQAWLRESQKMDTTFRPHRYVNIHRDPEGLLYRLNNPDRVRNKLKMCVHHMTYLTCMPELVFYEVPVEKENKYRCREHWLFSGEHTPLPPIFQEPIMVTIGLTRVNSDLKGYVRLRAALVYLALLPGALPDYVLWRLLFRMLEDVEVTHPVTMPTDKLRQYIVKRAWPVGDSDYVPLEEYNRICEDIDDEVGVVGRPTVADNAAVDFFRSLRAAYPDPRLALSRALVAYLQTGRKRARTPEHRMVRFLGFLREECRSVIKTVRSRYFLASAVIRGIPASREEKIWGLKE